MSAAITDQTVARWYQYSLSEQEAKALVGAVPGATEYGLVKVFGLLPEAAKHILRDAYAKERARTNAVVMTREQFFSMKEGRK